MTYFENDDFIDWNRNVPEDSSNGSVSTDRLNTLVVEYTVVFETHLFIVGLDYKCRNHTIQGICINNFY